MLKFIPIHAHTLPAPLAEFTEKMVLTITPEYYDLILPDSPYSSRVVHNSILTSNKGILYSIEGITTDLPRPLSTLKQYGLIAIQIYHPLCSNKFINSFKGLTQAGKTLLEKMDEHGIYLDLSHLYGDLLYHVLEYAPDKRLVSHVVVKDLLDKGVVHRANAMSEEELLACDAVLYGIPFLDDLISPQGRFFCWQRNASILTLVTQIEKMATIVGSKRIALGPDYFPEDDMKLMNVRIIPGMDQLAGFEILKKELKRIGFSRNQIQGILSLNALPLFR